MKKHLVNKQGDLFCLVDGEIRHIALLPNNRCGQNYSVSSCKADDKGVYSFITKNEFDRKVIEKMIEHCTCVCDEKITWRGGSYDYPVVVELDTTLPATGKGQVTGGGYHTNCGCGSSDKTIVIKSNEQPIDVLTSFALKLKQWNCFGIQKYIIKPI